MTALAFTTPWLLWALLALPLLIWILRAVPPAAKRLKFPGLVLLKGLESRETETARTPWWLMALRLSALAMLILGFAGPVLNPRPTQNADGPLLILVDAGWADAARWPSRMAEIEAQILEAEGRPIALERLTAPSHGAPLFQTAQDIRTRLSAFQPAPFSPNMQPDWAFESVFNTVWLSDGLDHPERSTLLEALSAQGHVRILEPEAPLYALSAPEFDVGDVRLTAHRLQAGPAETLDLEVHGRDPAGVERLLLREPFTFEAGAMQAEHRLALPPELRNRISRFELAEQFHAGAVALADDRLSRRKVALVGTASGAQETLSLLSPLHYLREALYEDADLFEGTLAQSLATRPDVIILSDQATLPSEDIAPLLTWISDGGLLLRFAGPRLAASDLAFSSEDPLLPVRLRAGGRSLDGALSWGEPKALAPFPESSLFYGLPLPSDVQVLRQVVAEPTAALQTHVLAALDDGTPLVTQAYRGEGQVVLFHVTATPAWSSLPLSELFISMLQRLTRSAAGFADETALAGTFWTPDLLLDSTGHLAPAPNDAPVAGEALASGTASAALPPGLYAGDGRRLSVNVLGVEDRLAPANWPASADVERGQAEVHTPLKGPLLTLALVLLCLDSLIALALSGRLRHTLAIITLALFMPFAVPEAQAQEIDPFSATRNVVLAHVRTGDARVDEAVEAGLMGLGQVLATRTTIETGPPVGISLETDELAFFPLLYWPIVETSALPSREAYAKLNRYLQTGGMILFDTRDADLGAFGSTPASLRLQTLALGLDLPPIEPLPSDHILTRTFYILKSLAGRFATGDVWVQVSTPAGGENEVRGQNDNVTPIVIGANDWAAAWAALPDGTPLYPVGYGLEGAAQREAAYRFGVNLVMHVLTGNYKSDQVHVPELLDRLRR